MLSYVTIGAILALLIGGAYKAYIIFSNDLESDDRWNETLAENKALRKENERLMKILTDNFGSKIFHSPNTW